MVFLFLCNPCTALILPSYLTFSFIASPLLSTPLNTPEFLLRISFICLNSILRFLFFPFPSPFFYLFFSALSHPFLFQSSSIVIPSHLFTSLLLRDADPEFGYLQSKELEQHLKERMSVHDVQVLRGGGVSDGYIEVRPKGVSKALFLDHAIEIMKANNKEPNFILAIGKDSSRRSFFSTTLSTNLSLFSITFNPLFDSFSSIYLRYYCYFCLFLFYHNCNNILILF